METDVFVSYAVRVSASDIVPEDYQNQLMYWRDIFRTGQFDIGDIANELVMRSAEQGFRVPAQQVFDAVGKFCGKSGRTVRYYAEQAEFYSSDVRAEFDMLPFSHFVFARSLGDKWREALEYSMANPGMSEELLRRHVLSGVGIEPQLEITDENKVREVSQPVMSAPEVSEVSHTRPRITIADVSDILDRIGELASAANNQDDESRTAVLEILGAIEKIRYYLPKVISSLFK